MAATAPSSRTPTGTRTRTDRCPGVLRPWPAADGGLVRIRLVGGAVTAAALTGLARLSETYADGDLHLTGRANLQVRGLPLVDGALPTEVVDGIASSGLLPSRTHELVRNVMVSPLTGRHGGRADLRPVAAELDRLLCAEPALAGLSGRFLFVLDDGRGDIADRPADLGLVALSRGEAQLRVGRHWGPVVSLLDSPMLVVELAVAFMEARGDGPDAPWHVDELPTPLADATTVPDARAIVSSPHAAYGPQGGGDHVEVPGGVLTPELVSELTDRASHLVVTPWHGIVVPDQESLR